MPNKPTNQAKQPTANYQQGSGTQYHLEHSSQVPDYGGNTVDPIAQEFIHNISNKTE